MQRESESGESWGIVNGPVIKCREADRGGGEWGEGSSVKVNPLHDNQVTEK